MHDLEVGEQQAKTFRVGDADTAAAMGSGGLKVLATPRLIAWMEHVAFKMIQMHLDPNQSTVGAEIRCRHLAPTLLEKEVRVVCKLVTKENKRLVFDIKAWDEGDTLVGEAQHTRFIIDMKRFVENATKNN